MVDFVRKEFRTAAWHIREDGVDGYCYWTYVPHYDEIGVENGEGHLKQCKQWPSFGHGMPSATMKEEAALQMLARIEEENDRAYPRVTFRKMEHYKGIGHEYLGHTPLGLHPRLRNEATEKDWLTAQLNAAASPRDFDDRTWRTTAFFVTEGSETRYNAFWEIRSCPEREKTDAGQCRVYTWRIGPKSVYSQFFETDVASAVAHLQYMETKHQSCSPASTELPLPQEYFSATDYRNHPSLHPEDVTVGKKILRLKQVRLKT